MAIDYVALKAELDTDPLGLGYKNGSGVFKSNQNISDTINAIPAIPSTGRMITDGRTLVKTSEVVEATVRTEFDAISATEKQRWGDIVAAGQVNPSGTNTKDQFRAMFANGTVSRANLLNLANQAVSRSTFLFGERVEPWDVARAKDL